MPFALPDWRASWQTGQFGGNLQSYATRKGVAHLWHRSITDDLARKSRAMTQASVMSAGCLLSKCAVNLSNRSHASTSAWMSISLSTHVPPIRW